MLALLALAVTSSPFLWSRQFSVPLSDFLNVLHKLLHPNLSCQVSYCQEGTINLTQTQPYSSTKLYMYDLHFAELVACTA